MQQQDVIVIGAGIIGISTALALQMRGLNVRVLDRKGVAAEASQGNAGAFAFTDIEPLAAPGIMRKAPKWLFDPLGPLSVPPSYACKIAPWMLRFWRASWPDRYKASVIAQTRLMDHSKAALERQIVAVNGEKMMRCEGQLQLYEGGRQYRDSLPGWQLRKDHGIAFDILNGRDAIAEIQPGIHPRFTHAVYTPDWMNVTDPLKWTEHLANCFRAMGGAIEIAAISALEIQGDEVALRTAKDSFKASKVVVAAGAWSHNLARSLRDNIPLETERGYNTTLPSQAFSLRTQLTFGNHGFVVTKIGDGLRVGGAVELGGLTLPPNFDRARTLLAKAEQFLPGLNTAGGTQWMGFRPSLPDSLPVIGPSPRSGNVVYAFGHGHLGLTQAAGTAELVADIVSGAEPRLHLTPYGANRF